MAYSRRRRSGKLAWYATFRGPDGGWVDERAQPDSRRAAEALERKRRREVAEGIYLPGAPRGAFTVAGYARRWMQQRRDVRSAETDQSRLDRHIVPHLGHMPLVDLRPADVRRFVETLRRGEQSAKSVRNIHGVLSAMLASAVFDELIATNPAKALPRGILPKVRYGTKPPFDRAEVALILHGPDVDPPARMLLALGCLAALRLGEACGRRWRDIQSAIPLLRLEVLTQYRDRPLKSAKDDHRAERIVPVHPELRAQLQAWAEVWPRLWGRAPQEGDWIVPQLRDVSRPHTKSTAGKLLRRALDGLGMDASKGHHSGRRFFLTFGQADGANRDILRACTHDGPRDIVDVYSGFGWEAVCREVAKLRASHDAVHDVAPFSSAKGVEALGIEHRSSASVASSSALLHLLWGVATRDGNAGKSEGRSISTAHDVAMVCPDCAAELTWLPDVGMWVCDCGAAGVA